MTIKELSQLYYLNKEIDQDKYRLAELEAAATSVSAKITGLPHCSDIANKTAIATEIADIKTVIKAKQELCIVEYNRIMRYISGIDDSIMRQIITLRHIDGLSWIQVANRVGGGNTADSVRKRHARYIKKGKK